MQNASQKEIVLNAMSRKIRAWVIAGLAVGGGAAELHGWQPAGTCALLAPAAFGQQSPQDTPEIAKHKVVDLLKKAREAMAKGNLETADSYVSRAEQFDVNFGLVYFGDTTKKVRRDLERMQANRPAAGSTASTPNNQTSEPSNGKVDPFAAQAARGNEMAQAGNRALVSTYLANARGELAVGNTKGARSWHDQAAQLNVQFAANEDSPAKLLAEIQQAEQSPQGPKSPSTVTPGAAAFAQAQPMNSDAGSAAAFTTTASAPLPVPGAEASNTTASFVAPPAGAAPMPKSGDDARQASDMLLVEARRALAVGDVKRATVMVQKATGLNATYEFNEDSPSKVSAAIDQYRMLAERSESEKRSESYRRRYAELQLQQAEDLLRWNDFNEAERLANEAAQAGLAFGPYEVNPRDLLRRISDARKAAQAKDGAGQVAAAPSSAAQPGSPTAPEAVQMQALPPVTSGKNAASPAKQQVMELVNQSRAALQAGDLPTAEKLAKQAEAFGVPDAEFGPQDHRPWMVLMQIDKARRQTANTASAVSAPSSVPAAAQALYNPNNDTTQNMQVAAQPELPGTPSLAAPQNSSVPMPEAVAVPAQPNLAEVTPGMALFIQGEEALRRHDSATANALFRQALAYRDQLDPGTQQRLQDYLQFSGQQPAMKNPAQPGAALADASQQQQVEYRRISAEVAKFEAEARRLIEKKPDEAQAELDKAKKAIEASTLDSTTRDILSRRVARTAHELGDFVDHNQGKIELNERNAMVREQLEREQKNKIEVQEKVAVLVDDFNTAMDEHRYGEAQLLAKRAQEIAPNELVVIQLKKQAAHIQALANVEATREASDQGWVDAFASVEASAVATDDRVPYQFGDLKRWNDLTKTRGAMNREGRKRSEKELEIEQRLRTPVACKFRDMPLAQLMDNLQRLAGVSIYLDPRGLAEEGVTTDTPVTIDLSQEISLKSALNLVLEPLHLSYVIKDEVLKITSEQLRDDQVYTVTYYVGDLVSPIPNFSPNSRMGLAGALADAHARVGVGQGAMNPAGSAPAPMALLASAAGDQSPSNAVVDPRILAQFNLPPGAVVGGGGPPQTGVSQPISFGPGGMGGGVQPDFDSLIELITATIAPTTWMEVGGAGAVKPFETNLSLVISQTQQVHEEIADLLEQLRRLQDLQVTIEVRFVTLSDNFFEQIGIDFDVEMNDYVDKPYQIFGNFDPSQSTQYVIPPNTSIKPPTTSTAPNPNPLFPSRNLADRDLTRSQSISVGMQAPGVFSSDLDIPFTQSSFATAAAVPSLFGTGATGIAGGAQLGFAILSDLEAYFFMRAVQSDIRTNIMQAPKVTLFNGQQAFVSDTIQTPFVITVLPVVGDFAAAQQPVIVVLSEGTFLTVQAVVSTDRRFVRLTVVPFFSDIGDVNTFTFEGSSTTTRSSSSDGPEDATTARDDEEVTTASGTTVQLPTFAFQTVTTTVSVPDGGTVLLGGIKRLAETRRENGVPILSKLPYINRLFTNIGTGKSTSSLMMMVTPRIIIQEEEELNIGVTPPP